MSDFVKSQSHDSGSRMEASILHDLMAHGVFEANGIQERESVVGECSKLALKAKQLCFSASRTWRLSIDAHVQFLLNLGQWSQF
jgi:hypothetical protein